MQCYGRNVSLFKLVDLQHSLFVLQRYDQSSLEVSRLVAWEIDSKICWYIPSPRCSCHGTQQRALHSARQNYKSKCNAPCKSEFDSTRDTFQSWWLKLSQYIRRIPGIKVYYPFVNSTKALYNDCRRAKGQYGNVMSIKFEVQKDAINFYNALHIAKGPMLGTNFSLAFAQEQVRSCRNSTEQSC